MKIKVIDNGAGISRDKLSTLRAELLQSEEVSGRHIGLLNTNKRLVLLYGAEYGICIRGKEGTCTSVQLRIPLNPV